MNTNQPEPVKRHSPIVIELAPSIEITATKGVKLEQKGKTTVSFTGRDIHETLIRVDEHLQLKSAHPDPATVFEEVDITNRSKSLIKLYIQVDGQYTFFALNLAAGQNSKRIFFKKKVEFFLKEVVCSLPTVYFDIGAKKGVQVWKNGILKHIFTDSEFKDYEIQIIPCSDSIWIQKTTENIQVLGKISSSGIATSTMKKILTIDRFTLEAKIDSLTGKHGFNLKYSVHFPNSPVEEDIRYGGDDDASRKPATSEEKPKPSTPPKENDPPPPSKPTPSKPYDAFDSSTWT